MVSTAQQSNVVGGYVCRMNESLWLVMMHRGTIKTATGMKLFSSSGKPAWQCVLGHLSAGLCSPQFATCSNRQEMRVLSGCAPLQVWMSLCSWVRSLCQTYAQGGMLRRAGPTACMVSENVCVCVCVFASSLSWSWVGVGQAM